MNGPRDYHAKRRKSERKTNTQPYPVLLICGILKKKKKCWYIFHFTPEQRSLCNLPITGTRFHFQEPLS